MIKKLKASLGLASPNSTPFDTSHDFIKIIELYGVSRISMRIISQRQLESKFGYLMKFRGALDLTNDKIIQIDYSVSTYLEYLCLRTISGRVIRAGSPNIDVHSIKIENYEKVLSFKGFHKDYIDNLEIYVEENPVLKEFEEKNLQKLKDEAKEEVKLELISENKDEKAKTDEFHISNISPKIKIIFIISASYCQITAKYLNFLKEISKERFIFLDADSFSLYLAEKKLKEFDMSSNAGDKAEISIFVIEFPERISKENFLSEELTNAIYSFVYFPCTEKTCQKNAFLNHKRWENFWKPFVKKSANFLNFISYICKSTNNLNLLSKVQGFNVEQAAEFSEEKLYKLFQDLYQKNIVLFKNELELLKEIETFVEIQKSLGNSSEKNKNTITVDKYFPKWARKFMTNFIRELLQSKNLNVTKRQKIRTYFIDRLYFEYTLNFYQRNVLTTILLTDKYYNDNIAIVNLCSFICEYLREIENLYHQNSMILRTPHQIIDQVSYLIDDFFQSSDILNCYKLFKIIRETFNNEQLNHMIINNIKFLDLIFALFQHSNAFFNLQGHLLLFSALKFKPKLFWIHISQQESKKNYSIPLAILVLNNLFYLCSPFKELDPSGSLFSNYLMLLEDHEIFDIKDLYEGSTLNCSYVSKEHIEKLIQIVIFLSEKLSDINNSSYLLGLFSTFLRFCSQNITNIFVNHMHVLLSITEKNIKWCNKSGNYGRKFDLSLEFFNLFVLFLRKPEKFEVVYKKTRYELLDSFDFINKKKGFVEVPELTMIKKAKTEKKIDKKGKKQKNKEKKQKEIEQSPMVVSLKTMTTEEVKKMIKSYELEEFEGHNFRFYDLYDKEQEKMKEFLKLKDDEKAYFTNKLSNLQAELEEKNKIIMNLLKQNKQIEQEKLNLSEKFYTIEQENEANLKIIEKLYSTQVDKSQVPEDKAQVFDEEHDEFLSLRKMEEITQEKAKIFIENLQKTRIQMKDLRSSICGALKFLGNELYSSSIHFFYELIQNAEDNQYDSNTIPYLSS